MPLSFQDQITPVTPPIAPTPATTPTNSSGLSFADKIQPVTSSTPITQQSAPIISPFSSIKSGLDKSVEISKSIGNALISSEKGFGSDIAGALTTILPKSWTGLDKLDEASQTHIKNLATTASAIKMFDSQGKDSSKLKGILQDEINSSPTQVKDLYPALNKTNWQVAGDAGGTLLDILSSGTYGELAKGAETGKLLTSTTKAAIQTASSAIAKNIEGNVPKQTLGQTLKRILFGTAMHSGVGAGVGYASDVTQNLKNGKTGRDALTPGLGTATGAITPALIGGVKAGVAIGNEEAPRFINSLIKPKAANFAYGKNPGRTVAELGITGNSLPDFENNIGKSKGDIGEKIGKVYDNPKNANIKINAQDDIGKLDEAITEAAKGGKNNQSIVTQLQNTKDALMFEHGVDKNGNITKVGTSPRDISGLSPKEAQALIQDVASHTQFTGRMSDDKAVNATLRDIYGGIRDKINTAVSPNNPEILDLNKKYGDLTSAQLATRNRDAIVQRSNMIGNNATTVGLATGAVTEIMSGHPLTAILAGIGSAAFEKALSSTAVKTRVASWLAKASPSTISNLVSDNPEIVSILKRQFPNIASKIGGFSGSTPSGIKYNVYDQ